MSCQLSVIAVVLMMYFAGAIEGETGNPCFNRINWCSRWAVDGWCQRNPRYMLVHCKLACGECTEIVTRNTSTETATTEEVVQSTAAPSTTTTAGTTEVAVTTTAVATAPDSTASTSSVAVVETSAPEPETTPEQLYTTQPVATEPPTTSKLQPQCGAYVVEEERDLAGKMLLKFAAASADACCSACDETAGCAGFAFFKQMCYLKSNLEGSYFKAGCQARVRKVYGTCGGFAAPLEGLDLSGTLIKAMYAPDSSVCCTACQSQHGCEGFSYFRSFCYLKSNVHGTYPKTGCSARLHSSRRLRAQSDLLV
mmetsp:Transcript_96519/g.133812  ORF Transcript_96519/g.133812 Transcript_96519/m.133812 type:complete len:310 (+) Transcript_96519:63-992(+)